MPKTRLHQLAELGQSVWLDSIDRSLLDSGKLKQLIDQGLKGMTSNPTIFHKAISSRPDYDERIVRLYEAGKSTFEIYDDLTIWDIQEACDHFQPVYESTGRLDGYVSLEINPLLAHDTKASIEEGKRLFKKVSRPNCMIKVPATGAGFPVIEALLAEEINVNVTLIFSLEQYVRTAEAYLRGLNQLAHQNRELKNVRSVASVFVSRIDTLIDKKLEDFAANERDPQKKEKLNSLQGKAAAANSRLIFEKFQEFF